MTRLRQAMARQANDEARRNDKIRMTRNCSVMPMLFSCLVISCFFAWLLEQRKRARCPFAPQTRCLCYSIASSFSFSLMHDQLVAIGVAKLCHPANRRFRFWHIEGNTARF